MYIKEGGSRGGQFNSEYSVEIIVYHAGIQ